MAQARQLLKREIDASNVVGLRDRAILAVLAYTSSRAGAGAQLCRGDFYGAGEQWMLRFTEKGGKVREIPVHHDLRALIAAYLDAAGLDGVPKDTRRNAGGASASDSDSLCNSVTNVEPRNRRPPSSLTV